VLCYIKPICSILNFFFSLRSYPTENTIYAQMFLRPQRTPHKEEGNICVTQPNQDRCCWKNYLPEMQICLRYLCLTKPQKLVLSPYMWLLTCNISCTICRHVYDLLQTKFKILSFNDSLIIAVTPKAKCIFHAGGFITKIKVINLDIFRMLLSIHHFDTLQ
jgi:hypothetical protein